MKEQFKIGCTPVFFDLLEGTGYHLNKSTNGLTGPKWYIVTKKYDFGGVTVV